jgi:hypothetical protein
MALLAEALVDEWMNRQGFFTVRGIRHGTNEIDLLGVRPTASGLEAWHVEVQASFRPMGYIAPVTDEIARRFPATPKSAKRRPENIVRDCAAAWVHSKFRKADKERTRDRAWPNLTWQFFLVHARSRWPAELEAIAAEGVKLVPLHRVLRELRHEEAVGLRGGAATDLSEIIEYYAEHSVSEAAREA